MKNIYESLANLNETWAHLDKDFNIVNERRAHYIIYHGKNHAPGENLYRLRLPKDKTLLSCGPTLEACLRPYIVRIDMTFALQSVSDSEGNETL